VTFTTLHSFTGPDGQYPHAGLAQATNGRLYGTTVGAGANGDGTIFKITSSGTLTTLHNFDNTDDNGPYAGLVLATNGNLYGATSGGGANGDGTIFKITSSGTLTTLHSFDNTDGNGPSADLVQATNGDFYGTTGGGGCGGCGTVFKITPSGMLTTLYIFCSLTNCTDGRDPLAGLVPGSDGDFYGTTYFGGANTDSCTYHQGCGTVFKITASGTLTTLHSFDNTDGANPYAGLVQATNGNFYGTTYAGGHSGYAGTVFKITPRGMLTTLYSFCAQGGNCTDGAGPIAGLVQATDGNYYGTTEGGGANNDGTVFKITPSGTLTTLHSFDGVDGANPNAALVQRTDGKFYGTTDVGGASGSCNPPNGCGTIFSLSVGLGPFVETNPTSGAVGAAVTILGNSLTGATSVTFNGIAATFTVKSKSEITTTVPAGATTGTVQVATPGGTRSSNVPFRVK
jgi:uncharacterized repeat protein (TIGR03803 family)